MAAPAPEKLGKMILAGLLTWLVPGAGHWFLRHRGLAGAFFLGVSLPFVAGLAIGGIKNSVNPWSNPWLFLAEIGTGGYTVPCLLANSEIGDFDPRLLKDPKYLNKIGPEKRDAYLKYLSFYPESDVAQIYLATAGLLNILAILDAISRAHSGLPTYHRELRSAPAEPAVAEAPGAGETGGGAA